MKENFITLLLSAILLRFCCNFLVMEQICYIKIVLLGMEFFVNTSTEGFSTK